MHSDPLWRFDNFEERINSYKHVLRRKDVGAKNCKIVLQPVFFIPFADLRTWVPKFLNCKCCTRERWKKFDKFMSQYFRASTHIGFDTIVNIHDAYEFDSTIPFTRHFKYYRDANEMMAETHDDVKYPMGVTISTHDGKYKQNNWTYIKVPIALNLKTDDPYLVETIKQFRKYLCRIISNENHEFQSIANNRQKGFKGEY